jgi:hypothetical protein
MAGTREEIYEEYRTADFSRRLDIYLQFPELRNGFHKIDPKDANLGISGSSPKYEDIGNLEVI